MAKKVVSVPIHKKNRATVRQRSRIKKLKTAFKKILNYMKSDSYYMFSPLVFPQSSLSPSRPSSFGELFFEPIKKKENKLVEELGDYLRCDCYMYAPLLLKDSGATSPKGMHSPEKDSETHYVHVDQRTEKTVGSAGIILDSSREVENEASYVPAGRIAVKRVRVEKETVKRVVHQNCRSSSVPGKVGPRKSSSKIPVG